MPPVPVPVVNVSVRPVPLPLDDVDAGLAGTLVYVPAFVNVKPVTAPLPPIEVTV